MNQVTIIITRSETPNQRWIMQLELIPCLQVNFYCPSYVSFVLVENEAEFHRKPPTKMSRSLAIWIVLRFGLSSEIIASFLLT